MNYAAWWHSSFPPPLLTPLPSPPLSLLHFGCEENKNLTVTIKLERKIIDMLNNSIFNRYNNNNRYYIACCPIRGVIFLNPHMVFGLEAVHRHIVSLRYLIVFKCQRDWWYCWEIITGLTGLNELTSNQTAAWHWWLVVWLAEPIYFLQVNFNLCNHGSNLLKSTASLNTCLIDNYKSASGCSLPVFLPCLARIVMESQQTCS